MFREKLNQIRLSPAQVSIFVLGLITFIGGAFLSLPISSSNGTSTPYVDALFTATSAASVTGLVVLDTGTHWSYFGQAIILLLIQIGGLGFMTVATLFAFIFKRRITLRERLLLQESLNQMDIEGIVGLVRKVLVYSFSIEFVGAVLFTLRFMQDMSFGKAAYFGVFHSIAIFNNAGFDLFGPLHGQYSSLIYYSQDLPMNIISICLIILGGIGFFVIADLIEFRVKKRLSLHTKVVLSTSGFLILIGSIIIFIFEYTNMKTIGTMDEAGKWMAATFSSVTPRSGGVTTVDIGAMRQATQFFIIILMFIGASPNSTGGGIKTTTFATLIGAIVAMMRGKEDIVLFKYRLATERILKAITLTLICLFLVVAVTMIMCTTERAPFLNVLFEVTSAFATCGLSMGLTTELTTVGKILIMFMMFVGRTGPVTLAFALRLKHEKEPYRNPEGKIIIG